MDDFLKECLAGTILGVALLFAFLLQRRWGARKRREALAALQWPTPPRYPTVCVHCAAPSPERTRTFTLHPAPTLEQAVATAVSQSNHQSRFCVALPCCDACLRLGKWRDNALVVALPLSLGTYIGAMVTPSLMLPLGLACAGIVGAWLLLLWRTRRAKLAVTFVTEKSLVIDIPRIGPFIVGRNGHLASAPDAIVPFEDILERPRAA
jgi:hypothetical protein